LVKSFKTSILTIVIGFSRRFDGWARSFYSKEEHIRSLLNYGNVIVPEPTDEAWLDTVTSARKQFSSYEKVKSLKFYTELGKVSFESNSAAGFSYGGLKGPVNGPVHKRAIAQASAIVKSIRDGSTSIVEAIEQSVPDVAFTRTQLTYLAEKLKVRNVWGEHFAYILLEGLTAEPLMKFFSTKDEFYFIGQDPRIAVPELFRKHMLPEEWKYAFDWSQFDASVQPWEIDFAFDLLESMLEFDDLADATAFHFVREFFIYRKVAGPDGYIYFKRLGIPSGSYYTSLIGSIVNYNRIQYMFRRFTEQFPKLVKTQGDDSFIVCHTGQRIDLHHASQIVENEFNWRLNPDKCTEGRSSDEVSFLSRTIFGADNYRDPEKLELLALYPEYEITDPSISLYRVNSILEESEVNPGSLEFVREQLAEHYPMPSPDSIPKEFRKFKFVVKVAY
jgi:hypothetical protein